ncbi:MAG: hypothetical protein ACE5JH_08450 [Acidobacteriota bacterium]
MIGGQPAARIGDADFRDLRLLGTALTVLGFEDIIFARRAAFTLTAIPEALRRRGSLALEVAAAPARLAEAVFDLQRLMRRLALEELDPKDLGDFVRVQAGRDAAAIQGTLALASHLSYREASGLGASSYLEDLTDLTPPKPSRIRELSARYLNPENWIVVKVGPASR